MVQERGIGDILKDAIANIQEIIRSEIQLAKIELKEESVKVKSAAVMFAAAAIFGVLGLAFCMLCAVYAIALVLPAWAAALIVGVGALMLAGIMATAGRTRWSRVEMPKKTMFTVKEDLSWMQPHSKS